jgi:signal transduction histidine kinase
MISFISINNSELIKKQQNVVFKQLFQASFLVLVLSTIIDYLNNSMTTAIVNTATTVFIFPLIYVLQKKQYHQSARAIFLFTLNMIVFLNATSIPNDDWTRVYFIPLYLLSFLVLDWTRKLTVITGLITPLVLFALSIYLQPMVSPQFHFEAYFNINLIKFINFFLSYSLMIYILFVFAEFINKFQAQYAEQNKFYSLGLISAGIGHEINNPLAIIMGKTDLLVKKINLNTMTPDQITNELDKIKKTSERIAEIVAHLKIFSRDSKNDHFARVSCKKVLVMTLDLCRERMLLNDVELKLNIENDIHLNGNESQLMQVALNLITNSFDAIELAPVKWIEITLKSNRIFIKDSGLGIPEKYFAQLMNPFFTTKPPGKGVGLGLSISKSIIENHHGKLVYDQTSENTCFIIEFPMEKISHRPTSDYFL